MPSGLMTPRETTVTPHQGDAELFSAVTRTHTKMPNFTGTGKQKSLSKSSVQVKVLSSTEYFWSFTVK